MTKEFDKLNYVPLPNLKESLKQYLQDEEEKAKVDKLSKGDVISRFRTLSLPSETILEIYSQYRYGKNLSFHLLYPQKKLEQKDFFKELEKYISQSVDTANIKYEKLPKILNLKFTDSEKLSDNIVEIGYKYHSLHKYFNNKENEEPSFIYETQYGFLWINICESYFVIISKDEKAVQLVQNAISEVLNIKLRQPRLTKILIDKLFRKENTKSATFSEDKGSTTKISYPSTAGKYSTDNNGNNLIEKLEKDGLRKPNARYKEPIIEDSEAETIDDAQKSVVSVNADKSKISVMKTYSTEEIRKWGIKKFSQITAELNDIKTKDISEIFEIFSKDIFGAKRYSQDELILIKQICAVVYNALLGKKNNEIELIDFSYNEKLLSKFFIVSPVFYCEKCEEEHLTTCNICSTNLLWKNGLYCPACKNTQIDKVYSKCDNSGETVELKLEESIVLIPNNELNTIISQFAGQMQEVFNPEQQRFCIKNSMLYYYNSVNNAEVKITELSHFNNLDLTLQVTDSVEYANLKTECLNLPEKCKSSNQKNCSNCLETNNRFCLMKMFKYIESTYNLQPHKGQEYGDVSF